MTPWACYYKLLKPLVSVTPSCGTRNDLGTISTRVAVCRSQTRYYLKYELLLHISVTVIHESSSRLIVKCPSSMTSCSVYLVPGSTHYYVLTRHCCGHYCTCKRHQCRPGTAASSLHLHRCTGLQVPSLQFCVPTDSPCVLLVNAGMQYSRAQEM